MQGSMLFVAGLCAMLTVLPTLISFAHETAQWIQDNPRFVARNGRTHCCGLGDCEKIKAHLVREHSMVLQTSDGLVTVRGYMVPFRREEVFIAEGDHYGSIDEDWWMCGHGKEGRYRDGCAFAPRGGS